MGLLLSLMLMNAVAAPDVPASAPQTSVPSSIGYNSIEYQKKYMATLHLRSIGLGLVFGGTTQFVVGLSTGLAYDWNVWTVVPVAVGGSLVLLGSVLIIIGKPLRMKYIENVDLEDDRILGGKYRFALGELYRGVVLLGLFALDVAWRSIYYSVSRDMRAIYSGNFYTLALLGAGLNALLMGVYHRKKFSKYRNLLVAPYSRFDRIGGSFELGMSVVIRI
jgi:hypothetical protein